MVTERGGKFLKRFSHLSSAYPLHICSRINLYTLLRTEYMLHISIHPTHRFVSSAALTTTNLSCPTFKLQHPLGGGSSSKYPGKPGNEETGKRKKKNGKRRTRRRLVPAIPQRYIVYCTFIHRFITIPSLCKKISTE